MLGRVGRGVGVGDGSMRLARGPKDRAQTCPRRRERAPKEHRAFLGVVGQAGLLARNACVAVGCPNKQNMLANQNESSEWKRGDISRSMLFLPSKKKYKTMPPHEGRNEKGGKGGEVHTSWFQWSHAFASTGSRLTKSSCDICKYCSKFCLSNGAHESDNKIVDANVWPGDWSEGTDGSPCGTGSGPCGGGGG